MEFNIKNLGMVREARIKVEGLTVITGLNDTGKSFLSKLIYSIAKTVNEANDQVVSDKYEKTITSLRQIYSLHRTIVPFNAQKNVDFDFNVVANKILTNLFSGGVPQNSADEVGFYVGKVIKDIEGMFGNGYKPASISANIKRIEDLGTELQLDLLDGGDNEKKFKYFFDKIVIQKVFQGQINNLSDKSTLSVKVIEGVSEVLDVEVKDNITKTFKLKSIFLPNDATIIETPTVFQIAKFVTNNLAFPKFVKKTYTPRSDLPYTYYDLLEKLNSPGSPSPMFSKIFKNLKDLIGGELKYDLEESSFNFEKDSGIIVKTFNIATGIKSLGLVQLLINLGTIDENTIIIIDEPEVHLHPKWEIEYAKLICELAKLGIKIIISSHSPYLLRAIRKYSLENKIETITSFYFGHKIDGFSQFDDVTENPEPIFKALAQPMMSLS